MDIWENEGGRVLETEVGVEEPKPFILPEAIEIVRMLYDYFAPLSDAQSRRVDALLERYEREYVKKST